MHGGNEKAGLVPAFLLPVSLRGLDNQVAAGGDTIIEAGKRAMAGPGRTLRGIGHGLPYAGPAGDTVVISRQGLPEA